MTLKIKNFIVVVLFVVCCALAGLCACSAPKQQQKPIGEIEIEQRFAQLTTLRYIDDIVKARTYIADSLNYEALQVSPLRDQFLHAWLHLYTYDEDLLADGKRFVLRTLADTVGTIRKPLIQALCRTLLQDRRIEPAIILSAYSRGFMVEQGENSEIADRLLHQTLLPGQQAPDIVGLSNTTDYTVQNITQTLLVFYETDCNFCRSVLSEIASHYPTLQEKGIRIIGISADLDTTTHSQYATTLPWPDNLCDETGFYGENFVNWGVAATPILYLIDNNGKVVNWYEEFNPTFLINP